jgi:hypothetical protein
MTRGEGLERIPEVMLGPKILVRSLSKPTLTDGVGNTWQYLSRSDRHSKVACWGILLDLMIESALLREHVEKGLVAFGVNHEMTNVALHRAKSLDFVVCSPLVGAEERGVNKNGFVELVDRYQIELTEAEAKTLRALPRIVQARGGDVRVALEAKACMTEHSKALPRLFAELTSSHRSVHGSNALAVVAGYVVVNHATTFASPDRNRRSVTSHELVVTKNTQPRAAEKVFAEISKVGRRTRVDEEGFDAFGFTSIDCKNDGSEVTLVKERPAVAEGDATHYGAMIRRLAEAYALRFSG